MWINIVILTINKLVVVVYQNLSFVKYRISKVNNVKEYGWKSRKLISELYELIRLQLCELYET